VQGGIVEIYPALFFYSGMSEFLRYLIATCASVVLIGTASTNAAPQGFVEGQLKILSLKPGELDGENTPTQTAPAKAENYADYPLIILSQGERKQIARITANADGSYRAALPPGNYILDVEGRVPKRQRVRAQPFTIVPNETVHVDMTITTGFAAEGSAPRE
jgi:hypothetical protein